MLDFNVYFTIMNLKFKNIIVALVKYVFIIFRQNTKQ